MMIWFHGFYVAFVFSCLMFGALAYRQILDNLEVRRMQLGEDRSSFISAPSVVVLCISLVLVSSVGVCLYTWAQPEIYIYALPLILLAQNLQFCLRVYLQRTQMKTRALVVRRLLKPGAVAIPYNQIHHVYVRDQWVWSAITIVGPSVDPTTFRIFRFSVPAVVRILRSSTQAAILNQSPSLPT